MLTVYEERGIEKGIAQGIEKGIVQGIEKGIVQGERNILLRLARKKFDSLPPAFIERVNEIEDADKIDRLLLQIYSADSVEQLDL